MPYKNYLEVEREAEKDFYRICQELEKNNGHIVIKNINEKEWWKPISIKLGCESKKLIGHIWNSKEKRHEDHKLLLPPVTSRKHNFAIISINDIPNYNIKIKEEPMKKKSRFFFKIF